MFGSRNINFHYIFASALGLRYARFKVACIYTPSYIDWDNVRKVIIVFEMLVQNIYIRFYRLYPIP